MSKFLVMSGAGDGAGIAFHLRQEGNDVSIWIRDGVSKRNFDNLLRKPKGWETALDRDTIVVFDSSGGGKTADRLRAQGHHVVAGSTFADNLELDRSLGLAIMEEVGIKIPISERFTNWERGKQFVKGNSSIRWVFKPSGDMGPAVGSYVSYDTDDMVEMLDYFATVAKKGSEVEFVLQEFKEGVCVSTEGWFNGREFVKPFNHTLEKKTVLNDNLGPSAGCSGNIVWVPKDDNRIITDGIGRMVEYLAAQEYLGPMDLNAVINDEGVWGLEWTPRFGYDATPTLFQELFDEPVGDFLAAVARKDYPQEMKLKGGFGGAVHVSIPPYPSEEFHASGEIPIRGWDRKDRPHLYFYDVYLDDRNHLMSTQAYGNLAICLGWGETIEDALRGPYELADRARIPDKQYRTDLVAELEKDFKKFSEQVEKDHNVLREVGGNAG